MHYLDGHFIHSFVFKQIGVSRHVFKFPFDFIFHLKTSFRCWPVTGLAVHSNKRPASSVLHVTPVERVACSRRPRKKSNEAAGGRQVSCVTWRCVQHAVPLSVTDANPIGNWKSVKWMEPSHKMIKQTKTNIIFFSKYITKKKRGGTRSNDTLTAAFYRQTLTHQLKTTRPLLQAHNVCRHLP